jgi:hypothetical protein
MDVNCDPLKGWWLRTTANWKAKGEPVYRAFKKNWNATLKLKDHYSEKRPP